jgi:hypothetical protein
MARFYTFAEILSADHVQWSAYVSGVKKNPPGVPISEVLERTGGLYENKMDMSGRFRDKLRTAGQLTGSEELLRIAELPTINISLEHLRDAPPNTRIVMGYGIEYTPEEGKRLGFKQGEDFDPTTTLDVETDPARPWRLKQG